MEASIVVGGLSVVSAFGFGAACAMSAGMRVRRGFSTVERGHAGSGRLAWRLRNGVSWAKPVARSVLTRESANELAREAVRMCDERCLGTTAESLLSCGIAVLALAAVAVSLATASLAAGIAVTVCLAAVLVVRIRASQDKRRDALRLAVPDALQSMGVCFRSGLSLLQTFQQVAHEAPDPLRTLFARAAHRMEVGEGAQGALEELRSGSSVAELSFVAVALDVQHQTGGSVRQVLEAAKDTVESEIALKRSLRVQTAQAKLSARVVSVMPFVLIAVFSLVSDGFLTPFFSSFAGLSLLGLALGMQAAGIVAVRRMLSVEVG